MSWRIEWKAISDRISGLSQAGQLFLQFMSIKASDDYGVMKKGLFPQAQSIFNSIELFLKCSKRHLPLSAAESAEKFINSNRDIFFKEKKGDHCRLQALLTNLLSFQTEFTYQISDISALAKRLTERSFVHLNRSIIADANIRDRWKLAFKEGETSCEKLGAVHLLLHGIWAFKASAEGERTDLVLGEPLVNFAEVESTAETMVLTEWKVVRNPQKELEQKTKQAFKQARRYSAGILAGFELGFYRYLVILSEKVLEMPPDLHENDFIYRYVNIAVDPSSPSKK